MLADHPSGAPLAVALRQYLQSHHRLRFPPSGPPQPVRRLYDLNSPAVPPPSTLLPLLRTDHPDAHYAAILGYVFNRPPRRDTPRGVAPTDRLRRLLERNCAHPDIAPLVRELVPVAPCQWCGRPYLKESERRLFCCDRHRRLWAAACAETRAARVALRDKKGDPR